MLITSAVGAKLGRHVQFPDPHDLKRQLHELGVIRVLLICGDDPQREEDPLCSGIGDTNLEKGLKQHHCLHATDRLVFLQSTYSWAWFFIGSWNGLGVKEP